MPKERRPDAAVAKADSRRGRGAVAAPGRHGRAEIAVIHRPRYDDWSLPKGKVDPGETEPVAAVREIEEETGIRAQLGRRLATVSYPVDAGHQEGALLGGACIGGEFSANDEVDELSWLPADAAMNGLSYPHDRKVLRRFLKLPADTQTVLIVRHATAGSKARYKGDDRKRPLDKRGRAQAESLVGQLLPFGATELYAADRVRCAADGGAAGRGAGRGHRQ